MPYIKSLNIGNVKLDNNLILAPMAGVTDLAFRNLCKEFGAGMAVTEMVSAKAMQYKNKKCLQLFEFTQAERPIAVQIFGSDLTAIREAVLMLNELDFDILDFNMGCPVPKIVNNNDGSALMKNPVLVRDIVSTLVKYSNKPVTVKIRKGFDKNNINAVLIAKIIEDSGAGAVSVHGRTREQMYSGTADLDIIREVKEAVKIPVIGNGDVVDAVSAKRMFDVTGCDAIMIARGAQGRPYIFREIISELSGETPFKLSRNEVLQLACRHARMIVSQKGEDMGIRQMRKHIAWYTAGFPHSATLRNKINSISKYEELEEYLLGSKFD